MSAARSPLTYMHNEGTLPQPTRESTGPSLLSQNVYPKSLIEKPRRVGFLFANRQETVKNAAASLCCPEQCQTQLLSTR